MNKNRLISASGSSPLKSPQKTAAAAVQPLPQASRKKEEEAPLIDLGDDAPPTQKLATLSMSVYFEF